jgi:hypothetical protein
MMRRVAPLDSRRDIHAVMHPPIDQFLAEKGEADHAEWI